MGKRPSVVVTSMLEMKYVGDKYKTWVTLLIVLVSNISVVDSISYPKNFLNRISWYGFSQHVSLGQTKGTKISFEDRFAETIFRKCIYANLDMKHVI